MFVPKRDEGQGSGEDYKNVASRSAVFTKYFMGDQIKKNEMGGTCGTYRGEKRYIQSCGGKT
jgi:hypothetical protein